MNGDSWTCLMVNNGPGLLPDHVKNFLKAAACDLFHNQWDEMRMHGDELEGYITTDNWKTHLVGTRSGVLFKAEIDCENGTDIKVNFLLAEDDLKQGKVLIEEMEQQGAWGAGAGLIPVEELYRFRDLRGPSKHLH